MITPEYHDLDMCYNSVSPPLSVRNLNSGRMTKNERLASPKIVSWMIPKRNHGASRSESTESVDDLRGLHKSSPHKDQSKETDRENLLPYKASISLCIDL